MPGTIGDIASKDDLVNHLISIRAAGVYGIFAQACLHEFFKKWYAGEVDPDTLTTELPEGTISLRQFAQQLDTISDQALYPTLSRLS